MSSDAYTVCFYFRQLASMNTWAVLILARTTDALSTKKETHSITAACLRLMPAVSTPLLLLSPSLLRVLVSFLSSSFQVRYISPAVFSKLVPVLLQKLRSGVGSSSRCSVCMLITWVITEHCGSSTNVVLSSNISRGGGGEKGEEGEQEEFVVSPQDAKRLIKGLAKALMDPSPAVPRAGATALACIGRFVNDQELSRVRKRLEYRRGSQGPCCSRELGHPRNHARVYTYTRVYMHIRISLSTRPMHYKHSGGS